MDKNDYSMIMIQRSEYSRLQYIDGILDACKIMRTKGYDDAVTVIVDTLLLGMGGHKDLLEFE